MSSFPGSPKLVKGGLVVLDAASGAVKRSIELQYNPDTLSRSDQVQGAGGDGRGDRVKSFRLKGPAIESIKLDAEIDATDSLEHPDQNANTVAFGIAPQLAALESLPFEVHNHHVKACHPFSFMSAVPLSHGPKKISTIGAVAYTVGRDIVFGAGRYQPHSSAGQQLLALEAQPDDHPAAVVGLPYPSRTLPGFALNSPALTSAYTADINRLVRCIALRLGMRKNGRATISIVGHSDRSGDEKLIEALGPRRADSARQALPEMGASPRPLAPASVILPALTGSAATVALMTEARTLLAHPYDGTWWQPPVRGFALSHRDQLVNDIVARNQGLPFHRRVPAP